MTEYEDERDRAVDATDRAEDARPGGAGTEPVATEGRTPRSGPDVFMLFSGVLTLLVAAYVLSNGRIWLRDVDPRWLIAGGALVVGLLLLGASLRPGSGRRR